MGGERRWGWLTKRKEEDGNKLRRWVWRGKEIVRREWMRRGGWGRRGWWGKK